MAISWDGFQPKSGASHGNIVVFRNLKHNTDKALELFANKSANEKIFIEPYEEYLDRFNNAVMSLRSIVPTPPDVDDLMGEAAEMDFVKKFRYLLRLKNTLVSFADFDFLHTNISEQTFEDFKSKYLDIYDKVQLNHEKEKVSILNDVDFELELVRRDEINVDYILRLLSRLVNAKENDKQKIINEITKSLSSDIKLRSKRELIEKFINGTIPNITDSNDIETEFNNFWTQEKTEALERISQEEGVVGERVEKLIEDYIFTGRKPRKTELANTLVKQPGILQRNSILKRISDKLDKFIEIFVEGV